MLLTSWNVKSQEYMMTDAADALLRQPIDSIISFCSLGNNINMPLKFIYEDSVYDGGHTLFQRYAHSFGYYCDDDYKHDLLKLIKQVNKPITNPFFFTNDACYGRRKDIMLYMFTLSQHGTRITEEEFNFLRDFYLADKLNHQDPDERTPLMYACMLGFNATVKTLLANGADTKLKDKDGKTAIDLASTPEIKALLENAE